MKIFLLAAVFSTASFAQTNDKCKPLEKLITKINDKKRYNYSSVNKVMSLSQTSQCGEAHAGGIADIIVQSLVKDFVRTMKVASKTPKSLDFVAGYINATTDKKDLALITENATKICPKEKKEACMRIDGAARTAMKE